MRPYDRPLLADGFAYVVSGSESLFAVNLSTGEINWKYRVEGNAFRTPKLYDGNLYLLDFEPGSGDPVTMDVVEAATGILKWSYKPGFHLWWVVPAGGSTYVQTSEGLVSLDTLTGAQNWESDYVNICGPLTAVDGILYGRGTFDNEAIAFAIRGQPAP